MKPASATDSNGVDLDTPSPKSYKDWKYLTPAGLDDDPDTNVDTPVWIKMVGGSTSIFTSL